VPLMEFDVYVIVVLDVDFLLWVAQTGKMLGVHWP